MFARNLWAEQGLCNRSMRTMSDIVYKQGDQPPASPIAFLIKFHSKYTGASSLSGILRYVPIISETSE